MKTLILFALLFCSNVLVYSQSSLHIKQKHYEGIIFSSQCDLFGFPSATNRFTPSESDIVNAEKILSSSFQEVTRKSQQTHKKQDVIRQKKLSKYYRQYWGELNDDNDKIIGIVLDSNYYRFNHISPSEGIYTVTDGGPSYFIVLINITTNRIASIKLNGYG